jgi:hypothetical protein
MPAAIFTCCSECGKKLRTTFFCQECGQPSCSLDCYCRHEAHHAGAQQETPLHQEAEASDTYLEQAQ